MFDKALMNVGHALLPKSKDNSGIQFFPKKISGPSARIIAT
jgi:hypothetical protein